VKGGANPQPMEAGFELIEKKEAVKVILIPDET